MVSKLLLLNVIGASNILRDFVFHIVLQKPYCFKLLIKQKKTQRYRLLFFGWLTSIQDSVWNKSSLNKQQNLEDAKITTSIDQSDELFSKQQYYEAYELLKPYKSSSNINVLWRICRILYFLASNNQLPTNSQRSLIHEAYEQIHQTYKIEENNPEIHKWMAIILAEESKCKGIHTNTESIFKIQKHLKRALELNPEDITALYLLGYSCYQLASLTWFQRKIAEVFFLSSPPLSTFKEAYDYFMQVEELKPRYYSANLYMLGKCCCALNYNYRAKYYLDIAAVLMYRNPLEKMYAEKAKKLSAKLHKYDLNESAPYFLLN